MASSLLLVPEFHGKSNFNPEIGETERPEAVSEDDVIIGLYSRGTLNDYFTLEKAAYNFF